jgi:hypothetical protein
MANTGQASRSGPPIRDWRDRTARLLAEQICENEDRLDAGLITEDEAKARDFAIWTAAESAGADVVELVKAELGVASR